MGQQVVRSSAAFCHIDPNNQCIYQFGVVNPYPLALVLNTNFHQVKPSFELFSPIFCWETIKQSLKCLSATHDEQG
jgi:hypothetical protein